MKGGGVGVGVALRTGREESKKQGKDRMHVRVKGRAKQIFMCMQVVVNSGRFLCVACMGRGENEKKRKTKKKKKKRGYLPSAPTGDHFSSTLNLDLLNCAPLPSLHHTHATPRCTRCTRVRALFRFDFFLTLFSQQKHQPTHFPFCSLLR